MKMSTSAFLQLHTRTPQHFGEAVLGVGASARGERPSAATRDIFVSAGVRRLSAAPGPSGGRWENPRISGLGSGAGGASMPLGFVNRGRGVDSAASNSASGFGSVSGSASSASAAQRKPATPPGEPREVCRDWGGPLYYPERSSTSSGEDDGVQQRAGFVEQRRPPRAGGPTFGVGMVLRAGGDVDPGVRPSSGLHHGRTRGAAARRKKKLPTDPYVNHMRYVALRMQQR